MLLSNYYVCRYSAVSIWEIKNIFKVMGMPESYERGALTEATYLILISLCEERHGYGIMQYISILTQNRVNLGAGTLYGAINLLLEKGWITTAGGNGRKKLYAISPLGRDALEVEIERLTELLKIGKEIFIHK